MTDSSLFPMTHLSARERARALHWEVDPSSVYRYETCQGRVEADRRRWWNSQQERAVRAGRMEEDPRVARPWERVRSRYLGTRILRKRPADGRQSALDFERKEA